MPTVVTVTVKSSGGDYASLFDAEFGEQVDLVAADVQLDIECYSFQDTTATTFNGWTTDATRYVRILAPSAERHDGKWNTSKYRLDVSAGFAYTLSLAEDYCRVEGLQVKQTGSSGGVVNVTGTNCLIDTNILWNSGSSSFAGVDGNGADRTVRNCVVIGNGAGGGIITGFGGTGTNDNCTVVGWDTGINGNTIQNARNCYSGNNATADFTNISTMTTCASEDATGNTTGIAYDTSNFVSVTGGSEDLHLQVGASAALLTGGTDLSGTFTLDIDGETRSDWSIGADEIVAAPGGLSIPIAMRHYMQMMGVG